MCDEALFKISLCTAKKVFRHLRIIRKKFFFTIRLNCWPQFTIIWAEMSHIREIALKSPEIHLVTPQLSTLLFMARIIWDWYENRYQILQLCMKNIKLSPVFCGSSVTLQKSLVAIRFFATSSLVCLKPSFLLRKLLY